MAVVAPGAVAWKAIPMGDRLAGEQVEAQTDPTVGTVRQAERVGRVAHKSEAEAPGTPAQALVA